MHNCSCRLPTGSWTGRSWVAMTWWSSWGPGPSRSSAPTRSLWRTPAATRRTPNCPRDSRTGTKERLPKKRSLVVNVFDLLQKTAKTMGICTSGYSICYKRQRKPWKFARQVFDLLQKTAKTMEIFTSGYSICYKRQRKPWKFAQVLRLKKFLIKERPKKGV